MNPKKTLILFFLFHLMLAFSAGPAFCASVHTVVTKTNDEIEPDLRQRILDIQQNLFTGVRNRDSAKIKKVLSPDLLNLKGFDVETFINQMSGVLKNEFIVLNQYYSTFPVSLGNDPHVNIVPSVTDRDMLMVNNLKVLGKEAYNLFLKSTNTGWQTLLFLSLNNVENEWKINTIHFGVYSIKDLAAPNLYQMGKDAFENGRVTSCVIYCWAMDRVLRPAPFLQYIDEKEYLDLIESTRSRFQKEIRFPFVLSGVEFIGINVETTDQEGLIPVVYYLTKNKLDGPDVEAEARQLKNQIVSKLHGIEKDFTYMVLRAFHEPPVDPNKKYKNYGVVLELK